MKYKLKIQYFGGRGQSIEPWTQGSDRTNKGNVKTERDFVSRINNMKNGNKMSFDIMLNNFRDKFTTNESLDKNGKALNTYEHLIAIDDDGFAYTLNHGATGAVGYTIKEVYGRTVIHNHPNDSIFSRTDLRELERDGIKGIVASGKTGDYIFRIGKNFKYDAFDKALTKSPITDVVYRRKDEKSWEKSFLRTNKEGAKWLRDNAKKYGYTFEFRKAKNLKAKDKI